MLEIKSESNKRGNTEEVSDLMNRDIKNLCNKRKIPLIGWTVTDEDLYELATDYGCDNFICEDLSDFMRI